MIRPFRVGDVVDIRGVVSGFEPDGTYWVEGMLQGKVQVMRSALTLVTPARIEEPTERGARVWAQLEEEAHRPFFSMGVGTRLWMSETGARYDWSRLIDPQLERPEDAS